LLINSTINVNNYVAQRMFRIISNLAFFMVPLLVLFSCDQWGPKQDDVLARVGNNYLYRSDLAAHLSDRLSKQDSIQQSQNFIDEWARSKLLYDKAMINLDTEQLTRIEKLVEDYKLDVFAGAYKQYVVESSIDTIIPASEINRYYEENKAVFTLNRPIYQFRYIALPADNVETSTIKKSFINFSLEDKILLDSLSFQFSKQLMEEDVWLTEQDLLSEVAFLNKENLPQYIKKSQFFEIKDAMEVYLLLINDYRNNGETAPLDYVTPTIKNILLNQRKIEFLRQFDTEIIHDAIQSKNYEVY
jgi:hypothetical protein